MRHIYLTLAFGLLAVSVVQAQLRPEDESGRIRERFEDFRNRRVPPGATLPEDIRVRAIEAARRMENGKGLGQAQVAQPTWKSIGPYNTGGRVKDIIVHPTDKKTMYIGAAAGGVWKTTDEGESWTPLTDDANATAMGSLWFHPGNPDIIYAGTGESVSNANTFQGAGVMRSTDAGKSWSTIGLTNVGSISRIFCHPKNTNLLMAGCMNTNPGVYKSVDGGTTWTKVLNETVYDMSINPEDPNEWFVAVREKGIMYTSDGGTNWETRMSGLFGTYGRASIKQSATNPDVLYTLIEINSLAVIAKSTNRGVTWTAQFNDARGCFFSGSCNTASSQGFYDNYIVISPTNPDVCFAGGIDIWRTINGGTTWLNVTGGYGDGNGQNVPHVDQHCLAFATDGSQTIYAGNDGGMIKSTNFGNPWGTLNEGLEITQFYDFDNDPSRRERSFGGTQDNGTLGTFGQPAWDSVWGGDGMVTVVNQDDPDVVFGNNPNGAPFRVNFRTQQARQITSGLDQSEAALWVAPMVVNPSDGNSLLSGRRRVWRTFDAGDFWFETSPYFVNSVSALAISPVDAGLFWAASSTGEIMVTESDGAEWTSLPRTELSNRFVSDIECSANDRETAWITYSQYGAPNVWKTTDLGQSWTSAWGNMPDVAVNGIAVHPDDENIIFIATDIGVFATFDGGTNWMPFGKGLPRTVCTGIRLNYEFGYLRVVTHGRGAWETDLVTTAPSDPIITAPAGAEVFSGTLFTTISWTGFTTPVKLEYSLDDGATWKPMASGVGGKAYRWQIPNWPTVVGRVRVTSETVPTEMEVSRTFTIQPLTRGGVVQQVSVPWVPYGLSWDGKDGLWSSSFYTRKLYKLDMNTLQVLKSITMPASVGDSLFTDLTFDRGTGTIYLHKLLGSDGVGANVIVLDTFGSLKRTFTSQSRRYATGLEYVNGTLIGGERDGTQKLYVMSPIDGALLSEFDNPCKVNYGPRCLTSDDVGNLYQSCTYFPSTNSTLSDCYAIRMEVSNPSKELERLPLNSNQGLINARGIEYDRRDGSFWIGDFGGNIYKVTGFNFVPPPIMSVEEDRLNRGLLAVRPNPVNSTAVITLSAVPDERQVTIRVVDALGSVVGQVYTGVQQAGIDLVVAWVPAQLGAGAYTVTAECNGRMVDATHLVLAR